MDDSSDDDEVPLLIDIGTLETNNENIPNDNCKVSSSKEPSLSEVPVTILSGFLGAGKSTLVKYILTSPDHRKRIAVIENEYAGISRSEKAALFGSSAHVEQESLAVESMIVQDVGEESKSKISDLIELPNGCICCTVKDNMVEALETLLEKKGSDIDYILIEASGMANPGPIASVFWLDEALESRLRLDGIVTMVDSKNIIKQLEETRLGFNGGGGEAEQQIAFADRIIVNKSDLVNEIEMEDVLAAIQSINPHSQLIKTSHSKISDLSWILDTKCFDSDKTKATIESNIPETWMTPIDSIFCLPCDEDTSRPPTENHFHTNSISTVVLVCRGSAYLKLVDSWLAEILWPNQDEQKVSNSINHSESNCFSIFRIKGILSVAYSSETREPAIVGASDRLDDRRYIVQAVNDLWEIHPASSTLNWTSSEERCCKIVLIGRNLDQAELEKGFKACMV